MDLNLKSILRNYEGKITKRQEYVFFVKKLCSIFVIIEINIENEIEIYVSNSIAALITICLITF